MDFLFSNNGIKDGMVAAFFCKPYERKKSPAPDEYESVEGANGVGFRGYTL
jgi:hypothetical protein